MGKSHKPNNKKPQQKHKAKPVTKNTGNKNFMKKAKKQNQSKQQGHNNN